MLFSFFVLMLSGCTSFDVPTAELAHQRDIPARHVIDDVPVVAQQSHYCGPAALSTLVRYNGGDLTQEQAAAMVYTPGREGTLQHDVVSGLSRNGMLAIPVNSADELVREIAADHPVILFQNLALKWVPAWHYSVISGYDLDKGRLLVHDGTDEKKWQPFRTIGKTWKRAGMWGYTGVAPGTLPPTASEAELLQAAAGLERAKHPQAAARTYKTVLRAFPLSHRALFGLGNVAMSQQQFDAAAGYYRRALDLKPDHVYSINNLAYALKSQGKVAESCALLAGYLDDAQNNRMGELWDSHEELCGQGGS